MNKNYKQLVDNTKSRLNPDNIPLQKAFSDELATISYSDVLVYIRMSMKGVDSEYTQKSKEAGEKVKEHLTKQLSDVVFEYQGSVMTNTHIKGHSDIDLLTICDKFYTYDSYRINQILSTPAQRIKFQAAAIKKLEREIGTSSYSGNSLDDLRSLRSNSEEILSAVYTICNIKKPKAIKIKNMSLNREVDIVIANWYDDVASIINDKGDFRGIQVYNKETHSKEKADFPFLSINRINERSSFTNGRLKKMIRFLKNTKLNSDLNINLSSFDINAICYDIDVSKYHMLSFFELVPVLYKQLKSICTNKSHSDNLVSVDGREYIFREDSEKLNNVRSLLTEVENVFLELAKNPQLA